MASFKGGKFQYSYFETATSAGTLTLTSSSKMYQILTGTQAHTVQLPDATTMGIGVAFVIQNVSTGVITVQNNGAVVLGTVAAGSTSEFFVTDISTSNGVWRTYASGSVAGSGLGNKGPGTAVGPGLAIFGGGYTGSDSSVIDYVTIATEGTALSFGNLTVARNDGIASCASTTRALWFGGSPSGTVIDYVTIATRGNAVSFGTLVSSRSAIFCGFANATRGLIAGGIISAAVTNNIEYVTMASAGNGTSFGTLAAAKRFSGGVASPTRGVIGGGSNNVDADQSTIEYITIASVGNATTFGNLTSARAYTTSSSNSTRGIWYGGAPVSTFTPKSSVMDYITIATTGNATSFGSLTTAKASMGAAASPLRGIFGGGSTGSASSTIEYVNIATTSNSFTFGNLTIAVQNHMGSSNCHGGL